MNKLIEILNKIFNTKINSKALRLIGISLVALTVIAFWYEWYILTYDDSDYYEEEMWAEDCNVFGIELYNDLETVVYLDEDNSGADFDTLYESTSSGIVDTIEWAEEDESVKAIIFSIDSVGGTPVAAEEVANALKRASKPTVVLIREYGNSGAYYAATGADMIFASLSSDVGGIGVSMSYVDYAKQNQKDGLTFNQIISGKFKDMGDPDKILTAEEKALAMRDVKILHEIFIKAVAENRNLDIEKVRAIADGSSMLGQMALDNGLIDKIGDLNDAKQYLREQIEEEVEICW